MQIFQKFFFCSQEEAFLPKRLVFGREVEGGEAQGEEAQLPPDEVTEDQEVVINETEGDLRSLNEEVVMSSANRDRELLMGDLQRPEVDQAREEESVPIPEQETEVKPQGTGIAAIDAYINNLNKEEGGIDKLKDKVTPKTDLVGVVLLLLQMYLNRKNRPDMTGKKETWKDVEGLATNMFEGTSQVEKMQQLDKMLVEHKCNTPRELGEAILRNKSLEFDVVWDTSTNQFVIQHNFVSSDQGKLFTCKEAYGIMSEKGGSWSGDKLILDLKGRMEMTTKMSSPGFKELAHKKIQNLLTGMPEKLKKKLYLSTFDPYTEAMIWAYKSIEGDSAKKIKVMGDSMSIMSYNVSNNEMKTALGAIQGQAPGLISAFQGFFDKGNDRANHALHALSDRDGNGRADTKVHMTYEDYAANADYEANNMIATKDPIRERAKRGDDLEKLIELGMVISINDDLEYLKHIMANLKEGKYYGVKPEDIVVYGVEDANELYEVLFIAHQSGHKWNAVVHDVPIPLSDMSIPSPDMPTLV